MRCCRLRGLPQVKTWIHAIFIAGKEVIMEILELKKKANEVRRGILTAVHAAKSGHPGGSLSAADIFTYLYFEEMNIDPSRPDMEGRDRFVLSKGHNAPGLYAVLAERGYFPKRDLLTLRQIGSYLQGHPDMKHIKGVDMSSGSLGQGISAAVGMALAAKMDGAAYRVYALLGDGELQEGQVWEAAMFAAGRAFEQVRNSVGYPHLKVKIAATHAGISVGEDGATHQCNEDIALMRTIPGMTVICPSDDVEAKAAVKAAYEHDGPVYLRFGRLPVPVINNTDDYHFELGKGITLREGTDLTIVSTGLCIPACLDAAQALEREGISAGVINIHTIKPIDKELLIQAAKRTGKVVTVEEHSVIGGLGSAVADVLSEHYPVPVHQIGIRDVFGR